MQKITTNQYILLAVFCILTSKIMTMPAVIYSYAGKDAVFSVALNLMIDILLVILITVLVKKYPNTTFFELMTKKFGKIITCIINTALTVFILYKAAFLFQETLAFFNLTLYENYSFWLLLIPSLLTILYISYKGINAIGRSIDIYWFFVFFAVIVVLVISIMRVDFQSNLPYFENGISPILNGSMHSYIYTGNPLLLLFFIGKIELKPKITRYTTLFSLLVGCIVLLNNLIFYNLFTTFVPYCTFALSHLSQFNPFVTELGHAGWLSIVESTINLIFMSSVCCYCCRQYLQSTLKIKKKIISTCLTGALLLSVLFIFDFNLYNFINFNKNIAFYYNLALIPLILMVCIILCTHKKQQTNLIQGDKVIEKA